MLALMWCLSYSRWHGRMLAKLWKWLRLQLHDGHDHQKIGRSVVLLRKTKSDDAKVRLATICSCNSHVCIWPPRQIATHMAHVFPHHLVVFICTDISQKFPSRLIIFLFNLVHYVIISLCLLGDLIWLIDYSDRSFWTCFRARA